MSTVVLRGGVTGGNNGAVLEEARRQLAARKEVRLFSRGAAVKKEGDEAKKESPGTDDRELANYVNDLASGAHEFVLNAARPFFRKMDRDLEVVGDEVRIARCKDGDTTQTNQERRDDYESEVLAGQLFSPENDGLLREEAEIDGRREFVEALCLRVRHMTQIALTADDLRYAETKEDLEKLLSEAKNGIAKEAERIFVRSSEKGSIHAFGKSYDLAPGIFGRYHEFALEKLADAAKTRSRDLSKAHKAEVQQQKQKVSAKDDSLVPPKQLLFGNPKEVNEKTALFSWKFQGHENILRLRRSDDRLYIVDAAGKPLEDLEMMRKHQDKTPFVLLKYILAKDGEHLCAEKTRKDKTGREKTCFEFGDFVPDASFMMTRWVRTAAGVCIPSRLLPKEAKQRPMKANGELLTDPEFLYFRGFGEYDLIFTVGFRYEPRDEKNTPTGETFSITEQAVARIERKDAKGKDKIALKSASTEELAKLLEAGGAEVGHEYFEGVRGNSLPVPLYLGIGQAYRRLKLSEAEAS